MDIAISTAFNSMTRRKKPNTKTYGVTFVYTLGSKRTLVDSALKLSTEARGLHVR